MLLLFCHISLYLFIGLVFISIFLDKYVLFSSKGKHTHFVLWMDLDSSIASMVICMEWCQVFHYFWCFTITFKGPVYSLREALQDSNKKTKQKNNQIFHYMAEKPHLSQPHNLSLICLAERLNLTSLNLSRFGFDNQICCNWKRSSRIMGPPIWKEHSCWIKNWRWKILATCLASLFWTSFFGTSNTSELQSELLG